MSTFLIAPPPPPQRMSFMDALEEAGIDYTRELDGYYIYLKPGQRDTMDLICRRFQAPMVEEDPASFLDL